MTRGFRTIEVPFKDPEVNVYTSARVADALSQI